MYPPRLCPFAVSLLAIGLTFRRPPALPLRAAVIVFGTAAILYMLLFELLKAAEFLPRLAQVDDPRRAVEIGECEVFDAAL